MNPIRATVKIEGSIDKVYNSTDKEELNLIPMKHQNVIAYIIEEQPSDDFGFRSETVQTDDEYWEVIKKL